jgi:cbb3-type cytochrome oxidase cytochrome c subunit
MKHGSFLFLGLFFALSLSWLGMVATPQLRIGNEQPTNVPPANVIYPTPHSGFANLGREVYRANGCAYCHTQVVRQEGTRFEVVITNPGTNQPALLEAMGQLRRDLPAADLRELLTSHQPLTREATKPAADEVEKTLRAAGAEATVRVVPTGADIARGWGARLTVAHDYVYDSPLMLGATRIGPDLTNVGLRRPDEVWHLVHLYDPKLQVPGSIMPRYPFLFDKRRRGANPAADALPISGELEIVPTREARALAAYLVSLRAEMPLFEAPAPQLASAAAAAGDTNQPAATAAITNAPAGAESTNAPATNQAAPK